MEIKKESFYILRLEQKELDELVNELLYVEGNRGISPESQKFLNTALPHITRD